jgi:hypothetical protein
MYSEIDYRNSKRFDHIATLMLENENTGHFMYAKMSNYSDEGLYFETDFAIRPGTVINIRLDNPPFATALNDYCAVVKWCKELGEEDTNYTFGVGVRYC